MLKISLLHAPDHSILTSKFKNLPTLGGGTGGTPPSQTLPPLSRFAPSHLSLFHSVPPPMRWPTVRHWLECTQEYDQKYDLWPYKRRNTEGSITKNYRYVDLTVIHICEKFERNPSRNVACRAHTFPPKYDLWPYKRRNTRGSITKNNRHEDFTKIHLHTKYERNPSRNAAVRAHTIWTKIWPLTL